MSVQSYIGQRLTLSTMGLPGPFPNMIFSTAAAFPASNRIFYIPIRVPVPILVDRLIVANGATANGNLQAGVYSHGNDSGLPEARLITSGTVAQSGTSTAQILDVTDRLIAAGLYWLALTHSNAVGTYLRNNTAALLLSVTNAVSEAPGGFGLPATATPGTIADAYLPVITLSGIVVP